ncbi:UNVERIFIED_CONTAM: L-ascorbate peroxidase 1, cytosolic [Siphonaria sp. JEL0065]|nr:L-ascorbate peroxidase 1, cytosolic [Siphonaria sp. JEL0065]
MAGLPATMTFEGVSFAAGSFEQLYTSFLTHIQVPQGCSPFNPDMLDEPSAGMAALWLRAAFHDVGKYDPTSSQGIAAGLLPSFLNQTENSGIGKSIATRFAPQAVFPYSTADYVVLGAQVTLSHCGGPQFDFLRGRIDAPRSTKFTDLPALPDDQNDSYHVIKQKLQRLGFNNQDIVALVTGSHSLGGVHKAISPQSTNQTFEAFAWYCNIALDPELRPIVQLYANDQAAFFTQYQESFQKMTTLGQDRSKLVSLHMNIAVHSNLFAEGTVGASTPTPGQAVATSIAKATSTVVPSTKSGAVVLSFGVSYLISLFAI